MGHPGMSISKALVLCPTWNRPYCAKRWLKNMFEECSTSEIANITLLNDGGFPETQKVADDYILKDNFFYLEVSKSLGIPSMHNLAIKNFYKEGQYLVICEDDNYFYTPAWLQIVINEMEKDKTIGVIVREVDHYGETKPENIDIQKIKEVDEDALGVFKVISPEAVESMGFMRNIYGRYGHEDHDFIYRIFYSGFKICQISKQAVKCIHGKVDENGEFYSYHNPPEWDSYSRLVKMGLAEEDDIHHKYHKLMANKEIYKYKHRKGESLKEKYFDDNEKFVTIIHSDEKSMRTFK